MLLGTSYQLAWQKTLNKIPGASMANQPYVDKWGEQEREPSLALRLIENFVSPGYLSKAESDGVERELQGLYERVQDDAVLPRDAAKYFAFEGQRIDLTAEQYTEFATVRGQTAHDLLAKLFESQAYREMNDQGRAGAVADVYDAANAAAKEAVSAYTPEGWMRDVLRDPVETLAERQTKREEQRVVDAFRENLYGAVLSGDEALALDCVEGLRLTGRDKGDIKSSLSGKFDDEYRAAYEAGDMATVYRIEDMLIGLGVGFKVSDFLKWAGE